MLPKVFSIAALSMLPFMASAGMNSNDAVDNCFAGFSASISGEQSVSDRERFDLLQDCLASAQALISSEVEILRLQNEYTELKSGGSKPKAEPLSPMQLFNTMAPGEQGEAGVPSLFSPPEPTRLVRTIRLEGENSGQAVIAIDGVPISFLIGDEVEKGWLLSRVDLKSVTLIRGKGKAAEKRTLRLTPSAS